MSHPIGSNVVYGVHLRSPSASVGSKDWVGTVNNRNEVEVFWGKTGAICQTAKKLGGNQELTKIISEKVNNGYKQVDEYTKNIGWRTTQSNMTSSATQGKKQDRDYVAPTPAENLQDTVTIDGATDYDF